MIGLFIALNAGALLVALLVGRAAGLGERTRRLLLGTLAGFLGVAHTSLLLTGLTGHLTVSAVGVLLAGGLVLMVWRGRRAPPRRVAAEGGSAFTPVTLLLPLAAVSSAVMWALPHLFEATRLWIWDDYTYHMVYPTLWLRDHAIAAATPAQAFTMQAWYPLSASVVATWFMLPFGPSRGDALAWVSLTGVLYAGLAALGAAELLARTGCRRGAWALPVILLATSRRIGVMASTFSDADLAQASMSFAAMAFAVPREEAEDERTVRIDTWYAALLSGLALGVKISAALPAFIVLVMLALRARAASAAPSRWAAVTRTVIVLVTAWALTAGYWYARNVAHTGNPLYPAAFLVWPGSTFPSTTLLDYSRQYGARRTLADALVVYLDWPLLHALLALAGLIGLALWLGAARRSASPSRMYYALATLGTAALVLAALPRTPYSAGNAMTFRSGLVHWDSMRYLGLVPLLGWAGLGFLLDAGAGAARWRTAIAALIAVSALWSSRLPPLSWAVTFLALAIGTGVMARLRRGEGRLPAARARALALVMALITAGAITSLHGRKAAATTAAMYAEPLFGRAVQVLDGQPPGTRVAIFGDQWVYPTFGARTHLIPIRLDANGRVALMPIGDAFEPGDPSVDPPTLRANLAASGVGLVVVLRLPHPGRATERPLQQAALEQIADARLLYKDAAVAIWKLPP